ncbi:MAG: replication-relaxation family protein (plasmid) [Candidatus Manganitrophus sp.]|nr:MAG: replication-relaxation family protein [Candidatus Manganitrophus sp.]
MQKGLLLTDRDIDLLKYLAYGPAFSADLHERFFIKGGKLIASRTFRARMHRLLEGKCVSVFRPQRRSFQAKQKQSQLYGITQRGAEILAGEDRLPIDRIRIVRPDVRPIEHEIIVTRFIRKIYEYDTLKYTVIRLYDDVMLLKLRNRMDRIPDLYFTIKLRNEAYYNFMVEVDAGTTHAPEFIRKLLTFTQSKQSPIRLHEREPFGILIVCNTEFRMNYLQRIVMESSLTAKLRSLFAFNTIQGVDNSLGLFNPWWKTDGSRIDHIFKGAGRQASTQRG